MKVVAGGLTAAKGFLASGVSCGIKYKNKDLALIYSRVPCLAYGLYTQNKVQAAPIKVTAAHLRNNRAQAIIINSGNANCCTGKQGVQDARKVCRLAAKKLDINLKDVLMASTGIIGRRLPVEKIENKIGLLVNRLSRRASLMSARAIMTTDSKPKQISVEVKIGKTRVRVGGIAKGAGMIHPNLATMLAFITTDAAVNKTILRKTLTQAVENSFNLITVEGDTSTNDMVLALANGLAGNKTMTPGEVGVFQQALNFVCFSLARMIIKDAEGASKFIEIQVDGARDVALAKKVAFRVANSPLVKTAIFGENPNWGRIAACVGAADKAVRQDRLNIYFGPIKVLHKGAALETAPQRLKELLKRDQVQIKIILGLGKYATRVFTCDLSEEYVRINAEY